MAQVRMILVGGFLGAGKTTLLARAAERLAQRGLRVGLITNDQAANLVDTAVLEKTGRPVQEVSGACFCCAFNKLIHVADQLIASSKPDVIIGEPVGSCTDLSATVLQPIKKYCADKFALAPYSVLVDADRLIQSFQPSDDREVEDIRYIYRKQIEEADLVVLNKIDALPAPQRSAARELLADKFPALAIVEMSALSGAGVDGWLDHMLGGEPAGTHIVSVDYDKYAEGEAALGWLNAAVKLTASAPADWRSFVAAFLAAAQAELARTNGDVAHLKMLLSATGGTVQANLVRSGGAASVQGNGLPPSLAAVMVVNARVQISPDALRSAIEQALRQACAGRNISFAIADLAALRPGRPTPVHRFAAAE